MMHKQWSWRRSNQALFLFSLLLVPTYLFSADPRSATGAGAGVESERRPDQEFEFSRCSPESYTAQEVAIQDHILSGQDSEVRSLHRRLIKAGRSCNGALFYGAPGGGKTRAAHGIIRKAGFIAITIVPDDVSSGRYSETATNLRRRLDDIVRLCKRGTGIILDEAEKLFEKPEQENRDTLQTSTAFCQWIDRYARSKRSDIMFICTANDITHLPQHLLSRLSGLMFKLEGPQTPDAKVNGLLIHITIPEDSVDEFKIRIKALFEEHPQLNGRDLEKISELADDYKDMDEDERDISAEDVSRAIKKIMDERAESKYYEDNETEQERLHRSAMNHQRAGLFAQAAQIGIHVGQIAGVIPPIPAPK